jgi:hypothetical protein
LPRQCDEFFGNGDSNGDVLYPRLHYFDAQAVSSLPFEDIQEDSFQYHESVVSPVCNDRPLVVSSFIAFYFGSFSLARLVGAQRNAK